MPKIYQYLNPEINEAIEKLYLNININSKEQKEKDRKIIFKYQYK